MKTDFVFLFACVVSGGLIGFSSGIGFLNRWPQPKNIKIQLVSGITGLAIMVAILIHILNTGK
jgi:hypothetical protein